MKSYIKCFAAILTVSTAILYGCGEGYIPYAPPPIVITDSLILEIDSLEVLGHPFSVDTIFSPYNFMGVDSVVMTFTIVSTSDENVARLAFSELNNFDNKHIPYICGGVNGACGGLVTFKFNPVWNDFTLWFWFNVQPNSTFKFKNIRIYKAR